MQLEKSAKRAKPDQVLVDIAEYVSGYKVKQASVYETARYCLMDSIGCGLRALDRPDCVRLLGPNFPGDEMKGGARVPGTSHELDPIKAAFDIGTLVRYLDYNDTWLAAEWGHPSDNLGAILALADYLSRRAVAKRKKPLRMKYVLEAMIKAYEIQGVIALENAYNRVGMDHVILVRVASTAVAAWMLGASKDQIVNAVSNAWIDGGALRTYRHAPNTGSRKSWAAGDATSRAIRLALITMAGEMGYPSALSAKGWGFYDVFFKGDPFRFKQKYGNYVMDNILFKISYPAEFHAQTAVEASLKLHRQVKGKLDQIKKVRIETTEPGVRIIDKTGPLHNFADRDHCMQYMVAIGLIFGDLTADHYREDVAADPRIDTLREKMKVVEKPGYTKDYFDPKKRAIPNAVQVFFRDGSSTGKVEVEYPVGHKRRRKEGIPLLEAKFKASLARRFPSGKRKRILDVLGSQKKLEQIPVHEFMSLFVTR